MKDRGTRVKIPFEYTLVDTLEKIMRHSVGFGRYLPHEATHLLWKALTLITCSSLDPPPSPRLEAVKDPILQL